jgi:hypothetical protein
MWALLALEVRRVRPEQTAESPPLKDWDRAMDLAFKRVAGLEA